MTSCSGIKADGGRCQAQAIRDSEWCFSHHPDYAEQRRRRASKGGKRGGRGRPMLELGDLKARLLTLAEDVLAGHVDRANAAVAGQIFNTVIRAVGVELRLREQQDLTERLEELERLLAAKGEEDRAWG